MLCENTLRGHCWTHQTSGRRTAIRVICVGCIAIGGTKDWGGRLEEQCGGWAENGQKFLQRLGSQAGSAVKSEGSAPCRIQRTQWREVEVKRQKLGCGPCIGHI